MVSHRRTLRRLEVSNLSVIIIERDRANAYMAGTHLWFQGRKDFTAVVVVGPNGTRAFNWKGEDTPPANLLAQAPELAELI